MLEWSRIVERLLLKRSAPMTKAVDVIMAHAPALVQAAYQGLLGREADLGGLQHHVDYLRGEGKGRYENTLRRLIDSDEFLGLVEERSLSHSQAVTQSLPAPHKKIAIFANCQGSNLGRCIQALTGKRPPSSVFVSLENILEPTRGLEVVKRALGENDLILMQSRYAEVMVPLIPELSNKLLLIPSVSFPAFQPDQCYVLVRRTVSGINGAVSEASGPLNEYHSSIVYYGWRAGMSRQQTLDLFCDETYRQLRFYDYWDSAEQVLLEEGLRCDMPLDGLFKQWRSRGCFMHSPNHPKLFVVADLARALMQKLEIPTLAIDPLEVVWDSLVDTPIWPVYPEIARRMGIEGSYFFKGPNPGLPGKAPVISYDLAEFVSRSFDAYEAYSQKHEISCNRGFTERYREVFGEGHGIVRVVSPGIVATKPAAASRSHPYSSLPAERFWKKSIQQISVADVDPVGAAIFVIGTTTRVATAGSCFAQHISQRLQRHGFNFLQTEPVPETLSAVDAASRNYGVYSARYGNLYTPRQLLQLFDRAYGEFVPAESAWRRADGRWADPFRPEIEPDGFVDLQSLEASRIEHLAAVRQMFDTVDVFIFTLGLTEAWRSKTDGAVFPLAPGVVAGEMDASRYEWVNFGITEVMADLQSFIRRLAGRNAAAKILLTVSPVPLAATYDDTHVLVATTYSKSVLRVAAAETARAHMHCSYFPSYEIVTGNFNRGAYYESDLRSINSAGVDHVMRLFFQHYAPGGSVVGVDPELLAEAYDNYRIVCEEQRLAEIRH